MEEPVQALFLDEPVGRRPAQAGGCVGWGPIRLRTSTPPSVIGLLCVHIPCGRDCVETPGPGPPPPAPHLELSLPCDLRKFLSRFLDRKATSSSLVLEREWGVGSCSVTGPERTPSSPRHLHLLASRTHALPRGDGYLRPPRKTTPSFLYPLLSDPAPPVHTSGSSSPSLVTLNPHIIIHQPLP